MLLLPASRSGRAPATLLHTAPAPLQCSCSTVPLLAPYSSRLGSSVLQCSSTLAHNPLQFETLQCMLPCFALNTAPTYKYNTWLVFAPGTASGGQGTCLGRKAPLGHHWGGRHHLGPENISSCLLLGQYHPHCPTRPFDARCTICICSIQVQFMICTFSSQAT